MSTQEAHYCMGLPFIGFKKKPGLFLSALQFCTHCSRMGRYVSRCRLEYQQNSRVGSFIVWKGVCVQCTQAKELDSHCLITRGLAGEQPKQNKVPG